MRPFNAAAVGRRQFLASTALATLALMHKTAAARTFKGGMLPFVPGSTLPPVVVRSGPWLALTPTEARLLEAIVDRLIPADDLSVGGKEAGCVVYIDSQLAGDYGSSARLYMRPPFLTGGAVQGDQSALAPLARYREGLAALETYCRNANPGRSFAELPVEQQDALLASMEATELWPTGRIGSTALFKLLLQNTMEGFFADPVYGGNRDMASWRMIGFPGTRYDYRDHAAKHNQRYTMPPVSIMGRTEWIVRN